MGIEASRQGLYAVSTNNQDKKDNETHIYRHPKAIGQDLNEIMPEIKTMQDVLNHRFKDTNAQKPFLGVRKVVDGKLADDFTWKNNAQVKREAEVFGSGLINLGLVPKIADLFGKPLKVFGIYSKNTVEYFISDIACTIYNIAILPIYDTLGEKATVYTLNQTKVASCLVTSAQLKLLVKIKSPDQIPAFKNVVVPDIEAVEPEVLEKAKKLLKVYSLKEVIEAGESNIQKWEPVDENGLWCFSYTSGTTGDPKGVMITHKNIVNTIPGAKEKISITSDDVHISYLPLAHVLERAIAVNMIYFGCKIGVFSGDTQKIKEDCQILRPTIFVSVPRLYTKFYDLIQKTVKSQPIVMQNIFKNAVISKIKNFHINASTTHSIYDKIIFKKSRDTLGGRVRAMMTGSAPIDKNVLEFLKVVFCCPIYEGYGQTEACGFEFGTDATDPESGNVGGPFIACEFKLVDIPDLNYFSTDKDKAGNPTPRGEIYVRGPCVTPGYYLNEEKTKETFTKDGWMLSGDVGMLYGPNNALKIIDRKKNIFKLIHGEYIAPEKLENGYRHASDLIQDIFVYGDGYRACLVAAVVVDKKRAAALVKKLGIDDSDLDKAVNSKEFKESLIKELDNAAKANSYNGLEKIKNVHVETKSFEELDLATTSFKVKRNDAAKYYKETFNKLYKELPE